MNEEQEKRALRRRLLIRLTVGLLVALALCTLISRSIFNMLLPVVDTVKPSGGVLSDWVDSKGSLTYKGTTQIRAAGDWTIRSVEVVRGAILENGAPILTIDVSDAALSVSKLEYALMDVKNELEKLEKDPPDDDEREEIELQLKIAEEELETYQKKNPEDVTSVEFRKLELAVYEIQTQLEGYVFHTPEEERALRRQLEIAQLELKNYEQSQFFSEAAETDKLELAVLQMQNKLDGEKPQSTEGDMALLKKQIDVAAKELTLQKGRFPADGVIKAPYAGTLVELKAKEGQTLKKGELVAEIISEESKPAVEWELSAEAGKQYHDADQAQVTLVGIDKTGRTAKDVILTCRVGSREFDPEANLWKLTALLEYDKAIPDGTTIKVRFQKTSDPYQTILPRTCLRKDPTGQGYTVLAVQEQEGLFSKENVLREISVKVVEENNLSAAVLSSDLFPDVKVVSHSSKAVEAGDAVSLGAAAS